VSTSSKVFHVKYGVYLPNFGSYADVAAAAELAGLAERSGWDGVFVCDHVARPEGVLPMADPWIMLTAIALATSSVQIGALVTPLARRRPWNVAREVVTLDHLSSGRMVFGVGLGIAVGPEFQSFGEESDPRVRGDLLDEGLAIVRAAWTGEPVTYAGTHHQLDGVAFLPTPAQESVPVWVATERVQGRPVRRAAACDGVFPVGLSPSVGPALMAEIALHRAGEMDGYELVTLGTDNAGEWEQAGATWWLRLLNWFRPLERGRAVIEAGPPA
jgi:alkanesulfonate monooxygenase SsuD/methylene tetrahydromethanopterin reductase-like flavin-dependent oxidoreductase (luciferase family)